MPVIEDLVTQLSFNYDAKKLDKFNDSLNSIFKSIALLVSAAGFGKLIQMTRELTRETAELGDELIKLSDRLNLNIQEVQQLSFVEEINGGTTAGLTSSLEGLTLALSQAAMGAGGAVETLGMLGVSATDSNGKVKTATTALKDIAKAIHNINDPALQLDLATQLGITPGLFLQMKKVGDFTELMERRNKIGFTLSKEQGRQSEAYIDSLTEMGIAFQTTAQKIGSLFMPALTKINNMFIKWFVTNKKLISQKIDKFFDGLVKTVKILINVFYRFQSILQSVVRSFGGTENAIKLLMATLLLLKGRLLLVALAPLAMGIAIGVLIEDLHKFAKGADSVIGDLIKKFPLLEKPVKALIWLIEKVATGWSMIFGKEGVQALDDFILTLNDVKTKVKELYEDLEALVNKPINWVIESYAKVKGYVSGLATPNTNTPITSSSSVINNRTVNNSSSPGNITVNINGGDLKQVENTIMRVMGSQINSTKKNFESGVVQ